MTAKELFLKDKDLSAKWAAIAHGELLPLVLLHVRGAFMQTGPSRDGLVAVETFIHLLEHLSDNDDQPFDFPSPGLFHQVDAMPEKPKKD